MAGTFFNSPTRSLFVISVFQKTGLISRAFQCDEFLELYFDIYRDDGGHCYAAMGWSDPGVRIAESVSIPQFLGHDVYFLGQLANACALNGVAISWEDHDRFTEIRVEAVIYFDQLAPEPVLATVTEVLKCVDLVRQASAFWTMSPGTGSSYTS